VTANYSSIVSCGTHFFPGGRNSGSMIDRVISNSRYNEAHYDEAQLYNITTAVCRWLNHGINLSKCWTLYYLLVTWLFVNVTFFMAGIGPETPDSSLVEFAWKIFKQPSPVSFCLWRQWFSEKEPDH